MKPCKDCPFLRNAPLGYWHPYEYLYVSYLGSMLDFTGDHDFSHVMGCHHSTKDNFRICGGWAQSAHDSLAVKAAIMRGRLKPTDVLDSDGVFSVEEMVKANGFDLDLLPERRFPFESGKYESFQDWACEVNSLRASLERNPDYAWSFVTLDSPLGRSFSEHAFSTQKDQGVSSGNGILPV